MVDRHPLTPGTASSTEECEAEIWFGEAGTRTVAGLTEQVMHLGKGYALLLLHAEIRDDDDFGPAREDRWGDRYLNLGVPCGPPGHCLFEVDLPLSITGD